MPIPLSSLGAQTQSAAPNEPAVNADSGFLQNTIKTLKEGGAVAAHRVGHSGAPGLAIPVAKAVGSGMLQLGELAVEGISGLSNSLMSDRSKDPFAGFEEGRSAAETAIKHATNVFTKITGINLAPKDREEKAISDLLGIIPAGVDAAGDTVYEKTGSAILGSGTKAVGTLLLLKPSVAGDMLRVVKKSPKAKTDFQAASISEPETTQTVIDHIGKNDEQLKNELQRQHDEARKTTKAERETIGRQVENNASFPEGEKMANAASGEAIRRVKEQKAAGIKQYHLNADGTVDPIMEGVDAVDLKARDKGLIVQRDGNGKLSVLDRGNVPQAHIKGMLFRAMQKGLLEPGPKEVPSKITLPEAHETMDMSLSKEERAIQREGVAARRDREERERKGDKPLTTAEIRARLEEGAGEAPKKKPKFTPTGRKTPEGKPVFRLQRPPADVMRGGPKVTPEERALGRLEEIHKVREAFKQFGDKAPEIEVEITLSPEQVSAGMRDVGRKGYEAMEAKPELPPGAEDPVMFMDNDKPVKQSEVQVAVRSGVRKTPGMDVARGGLKYWADQFQRTFAVETLGREAEIAASTIQRVRWNEMQRASTRFHTSDVRRKFWNARMNEASKFMQSLSQKTEWRIQDPVMKEMAEQYRKRMQDVALDDVRAGFKHNEDDHYLPRLFEDPQAVRRWLKDKYGKNWEGATYSEVAKVFKPKYSNPEDIIAAREHSSDVQHTKADLLKELEKYGVAVKVEEGKSLPDGFSPTTRASPTGESYWLHEHANQVYKNAFDSYSLWGDQGPIGKVFRGFMAAKNSIIPIRLMSLFHLFHEALGLDNATALLRAEKDLIAGKSDPVATAKSFFNASIPFKGSFWDNPRLGHPLLKAYRGEIPFDKLTATQKQALWLMQEGGFTPDMPQEFRTNAMRNFQNAIQQMSRENLKAAGKATFWSPWAAIQATMIPMFDHWIPSLKIAAYLKGAAQAIHLRPELLKDPLERQLALAKIRKGIDERYGEMSYNAMFWPRWIKDLGVLNTLSLGWQMGVLKQFGGAPIDLLKAAPDVARGKVKEATIKGKLDKPLFALSYTTVALAYTGLFSYLMSGQPPKGLDWFFPRSGGEQPDGKPNRVGTVFFTREFASLAKHIENEGLVSGLTDLVRGKASGLVGIITEAVRGVNSFGEEIRNPENSAYQQAVQTLSAIFRDVEPIAAQSIQKSPPGAKSVALSISGLTPAPKYITETRTEAQISLAYKKYVAPSETSFDKAMYSKSYREVRELYNQGRPEYADKLDDMTTEFQLNSSDRRRILRSLSNPETSIQRMFSKLDWQQQKALLDKMTPEEREQYLPHADKKRLRHQYESTEQ